ncbi:MAG TPA: hypothetical protein VM261_03765 [Kofleriaceae bacterium]|nr:hypothetical protein [Kofleriaceae bacterium]
MTERDDSPLDLSSWSAPTPPRGISNRVMDAVRASADATADVTIDETGARTPPREPGRPRWRGIAMGLAAGTAAAAIAWAAWPRTPDQGAASGHVVAGAPSKVTLGNGTVALLGAGADLTWERTPDGLAVTHGAGNVTYQHAGPSRLVIRTPFAEVHTASASFNVEVPMSSKSKVAIAGVAGAGVAAAIVIAVYEGKAEVRKPTTAAQVVEAGGQVAIAPPSTARPSFTPVAKATKDRAQRDALAAAIAQARAARTAAPAGGSGGGSGAMPAGAALTTGPGPADKVDLTPGQLSKEEIRTGVREVLPMLTDCYALMVEKYPTFAGKVTARLVVEAEPDLGTIVTMRDDSQLAMDAKDVPDAEPIDRRQLHSDTADFNQCLTATLESVVLPPLGDKDGGTVEITYPFIFAPSEEEADQYNDDAPTPPGPTQKQTQPKPTSTLPGDDDLTTDELLAEAETAAKSSQWGRAVALAERILAKQGIPAATTNRAGLVAALGYCNLGNARAARRAYTRVMSNAKTLVRQRCLSHGIEVELGGSKQNDDNGVMNPFK